MNDDGHIGCIVPGHGLKVEFIRVDAAVSADLGTGKRNEIAWYYHSSRNAMGWLMFVNSRRSLKSQKFDLRYLNAEGNLISVPRRGTSFVWR